jgi:hypothetical protein
LKSFILKNFLKIPFYVLTIRTEMTRFRLPDGALSVPEGKNATKTPGLTAGWAGGEAGFLTTRSGGAEARPAKERTPWAKTK